MNDKKLERTDSWQNLSNIVKPNHCNYFPNTSNLQELNQFIIEDLGFYLDFSKQYINTEVLQLLVNLANELNLTNEISKLFDGDIINFTEQRAAYHTALRNKSSNRNNVLDDEISVSKRKIINFCSNFHSGKLDTVTNKKFKYVVNIGIGGSDLGPKMVCEALWDYRTDIDVFFVSNIDFTELERVLAKVQLDQTLFIISSKTFTTTETLTNANTVKELMIESYGISSISKHFIAVSTNITACIEFGIIEENIFKFWDWVGGRFSLWSPIGISIALSIGWENFELLLNGASEMDSHFQNTPLEKNMPVILALLGVWNRNFMDFGSNAIVPYSKSLSKFPEYLQQLEMESNGKTINKFGEKINYKTAGVTFGVSGTDAQHSFFQLLHQGSDIIPVDFIGIINQNYDKANHSLPLNANLVAQSEALLIGKNIDKVKIENENENTMLLPHKVFDGNKPSTTLLLDSLTPKNLGKLIALYEHKTFVQGIIWQINSFDQWGVELGKQLAKTIVTEIAENKVNDHDLSTQQLINKIKKPLA